MSSLNFFHVIIFKTQIMEQRIGRVAAALINFLKSFFLLFPLPPLLPAFPATAPVGEGEVTAARKGNRRAKWDPAQLDNKNIINKRTLQIHKNELIKNKHKKQQKCSSGP